MTEREQFEQFGRKLHAYFSRTAFFFEWEESEDIMPIAVECGLAERTVYDPEKHGDGIEAEPGDEIWLWKSAANPSTTTVARSTS